MSRNSVLLLAMILALAESLCCNSTPPRPAENTNTSSSPAASPATGRVQRAKALIDENMQKTIPIIERIETAGKDKTSLAAMRQTALAELEPLALKEAEMYLKMTPAERLEVHDYMQSRLSASSSDSTNSA